MSVRHRKDANTGAARILPGMASKRYGESHSQYAWRLSLNKTIISALAAMQSAPFWFDILKIPWLPDVEPVVINKAFQSHREGFVLLVWRTICDFPQVIS
jgi:hypothetical protein